MLEPYTARIKIFRVSNKDYLAIYIETFLTLFLQFYQSLFYVVQMQSVPGCPQQLRLQEW